MANFTAEKAAEKIALAKLVSRLACVPTSEEVAGEGFVLDRAELDALIVACRRLENGEPEEASIVLAESAAHAATVHNAPNESALRERLATPGCPYC